MMARDFMLCGRIWSSIFFGCKGFVEVEQKCFRWCRFALSAAAGNCNSMNSLKSAIWKVFFRQRGVSSGERMSINQKRTS